MSHNSAVEDHGDSGSQNPRPVLASISDESSPGASKVVDESETHVPDATPHQNLRRRVAEIIAAWTIAEPQFPSKELLPRIWPLPYNNLGHQLLVDYTYAAEILWGVALKIRDITKAAKATRCRSCLFWGVLTAASTAVFFILVARVVINDVNFTAIGIVPGIFFGGMVVLVQISLINKKLSEEIAFTKYTNINRLLSLKRFQSENDQDWRLPETIESCKRIAIGDGLLSEQRALIFLAKGQDDLFPGLGWLQARERFICASNDLAKTKILDSDDLLVVAHESLRRVIEKAQLQDATSGLAVVINPETLSGKSEWLDASGCPRLFVDTLPKHRKTPSSLLDFAPKATGRVYAGLQIVLPRFATCASFFVRAFVASTGASMEVLVLTMGPPTKSTNDLKQRLQIHDFITKQRECDQEPVINLQLAALRAHYASQEDPLRTSRRIFAEIEKLDPHPSVAIDNEMEVARDLAELSGDAWPGQFTALPNWREMHSLTMIEDVFGTPECVAAIRMTYDLVVKSVLEQLDEMGYDISDYRDSQGQWTIKADRIDQMVVGERININDGKKSSSKSTEKQSSDKSSAKAA